MLAAALLLSACGYAVATGRFSQWFWNVAEDPRQPETSEDLLAGLGTVIGQSQTTDGVTVTLEGALWDGRYLMLSLSLEGEGLPANYADALSADNKTCWLEPAILPETIRENSPELSEEEIQSWLDDLRLFGQPNISYINHRDNGLSFLQIIQERVMPEGSQAEMALHLENLVIKDLTLAGPLDFTFTVESRNMNQVYTGDMVLETEDGPDLRITEITVGPFQAWAAYEMLDPAASEELSWDQQLDSLRTAGGEIVGLAAQHRRQSQTEEDGRVTGYLQAGPFRRVVDPAQVAAVEVCGTWVELDQWELPEP